FLRAGRVPGGSPIGRRFSTEGLADEDLPDRSLQGPEGVVHGLMAACPTPDHLSLVDRPDEAVRVVFVADLDHAALLDSEADVRESPLERRASWIGHERGSMR